MRVFKGVVLNILGAVLGYLCGLLALYVAQWFFLSLIPQIPFIPTLLSWPAGYEWYAFIGMFETEIYVGMTVCLALCKFADTSINYGIVLLSIVNLIRYVDMMIQAFSMNGFSFLILLMYAFAIITILIMGFMSISSEE